MWLHGDPHPANLLLNSTGLAGILDFGDLTSGDPANDLAAAWWCFNPKDRHRFTQRINAANRYDPHIWTRAAGWAASLASAIQPNTPMTPTALHTAAALRESQASIDGGSGRSGEQGDQGDGEESGG